MVLANQVFRNAHDSIGNTAKQSKGGQSEVQRSENDKRLYRALVLPNKLRVLLVSDNETDLAAAAMSVNVGFMMDPVNYPGLAHFLEHMLFMGTEKYPEENAYSKFLDLHGGSRNAYTTAEQTNYFFDVDPEFIHAALDRLSQFFIAPLFKKDGVEREMNAVNSEHEKNVKSDSWRLSRMLQVLGSPYHDYYKFGTGSKVSLNPMNDTKKLRDELIEFHQSYYSANRMTLTVLGRESLDELESTVRAKFSAIPNHDVDEHRWDSHPYGEKQKGKIVHVVPIKDLRSLSLYFPIPDLREFYKSGPGTYLSHLLGHEGRGSLLSELKRRQLCNTLSAGAHSSARGFGFFSVSVDLTEKGNEAVEEILQLIFEYIAMLKSEKPKEWIFRERESLLKTAFRFKDKESAIGYVRDLAYAMQEYPPEEYLSGPFLMTEFNADLIKDVLARLTPENMVVMHVSQKFNESVDMEEKWYGVEYEVNELPEDLKLRLSGVKRSNYFELPEKNEFIATDFVLFDQPDDKEEHPRMLKDTDVLRLWFHQDQQFFLPKACLFVQLSSPLVHVDPFHSNMASMLVNTFDDDLTEYLYNAKLAGLGVSVSSNLYGLSIDICGYSDKQAILLKRILQRLIQFKPKQERFEVLQEAYIRALRDHDKGQPYSHSLYYLKHALSERVWTVEDYLETAHDLTVEAISDFLRRFLAQLHIQVYIHGNADEETALSIAKMIETTLSENVDLKPLLSSQLLHFRQAMLPEDRALTIERNNTVHSSSATLLYLQCGTNTARENVMLELLVQMLSEPAFDQLRTKEQLGYSVWTFPRYTRNTKAFAMLVQSDKNPIYVESRIEKLLNSQLGEIRLMNDTEFSEHKSSLSIRKREKPKSIGQLAGIYESEISSRYYNFDRANLEAEQLDNVSLDDLVRFYDENIVVNGRGRRKISVRVYGTKAIEELESKNATNTYEELVESERIEDILSFRSRLPLYPLATPFMPIPLPGAK